MIDPFLKWPGGKRWLVSRHADYFPKTYERYIEPFLGGGSVFFHVSPEASILSDANPDLINTYSCVASHATLLEAVLKNYQNEHSQALFYRVREEKPLGLVERAARFIYLNRTCFNGMYRVNRKGEFNVPIGTKQTVAFPEGYLGKVSARLKGAKLVSCDFETTLDLADCGDFVFVDPPYTVMHNNNGFIKYNSNIFSWADQIRLSAAVTRAAGRGAHVVLTNADHSDVRSLYKGFGVHHQIARTSILSGTPAGRRATTELLITSP